MAGDKDPEFRITDRRKFNPDGSPRDYAEEAEPTPPPVEPVNEAPVSAPEPETPTPAPEIQADNVVSFPGEAARKREPEAAPAAPEPPPPVEAPPDPRIAQAKAAASAAEQEHRKNDHR